MAEIAILDPVSADKAARAEWYSFGDDMARHAGHAALVAAIILKNHVSAGCEHDDANACVQEMVPEIRGCINEGDPALSYVAGIALALRTGTLGVVPEDAYDDPGWTSELSPETDTGA
jgi:hypothetical protein